MRALELVGFRPEHWGYDYPDCYAEFNNKLKEIAITPVKNQPNSILLAGAVGTGKTAMMAILCKTLFKQICDDSDITGGILIHLWAERFGSDTKYCTHGELTKTWEHEFDDNSELPTEDYFKKVPILFLDDLFSAQVNQSGRNIAKLEELIDWRWSNRMKTFLATNISLEDLWGKKSSKGRYYDKTYHRIARRLSEEKWIYYQQLTHKFGGRK